MKNRVELAINTNNDNSEEPDGTITVELQTGVNYTLHSYKYQANTIVENDDETATIAISAGSRHITEGQTLNFTISASTSMSTSRRISYVISEIGNFVADTGLKSITLPAYQREIPLTINTVDDSAFEPHGNVKVTIKRGFGYRVAGIPLNSSNIDVHDNDSNSTGIAIVAVSPFLVEDEDTRFQIIAPTTAVNDRTINIVVTGHVGTKTNRLPLYNITLPANKTRQYLNIPSLEDMFDEEDYSITATVLPGTGYTVASFPYNSAVISIQDNDPTPVMLISAVSAEVPEGYAAQFKLNTPTGSGRDLYVNINIAQVGDHILGTPSESIKLFSGTTERIFEIATVADRTYEIEGKITVTILPGTGYNVANDPDNNATVTISNNDFPKGSFNIEYK